MLRRMLVAVDFSVWSRNAAQHALDMARAIGGTVTLLHVLEEHESGQLNLEAAHTLLRELSLLARRPPSCLIVPVKSGFNGQRAEADVGRLEDGVALAILEVADQLSADLIVIGLHGQGSPARGTLGQVMRQVLLGACIPVQVVSCCANRPVVNRWDGALAENASLQSQQGSTRPIAEAVRERGSAHRNASVTCREHGDHVDSKIN